MEKTSPVMICSCGKAIIVSSWPSRVLGEKPTPFGVVVGRPQQAAGCVVCSHLLCDDCALEHKSPDANFSKPQYSYSSKYDRYNFTDDGINQIKELEKNLQIVLPDLLPDGCVCRNCIEKVDLIARTRRQRGWLLRTYKFLISTSKKLQENIKGDKEVSDIEIGDTQDNEDCCKDFQHDEYEFLHPPVVEEDTAMAKAGRVIDGAYSVVQYIPGLGATVSLAINGAGLARQYGVYGLAGLIHREELTKAVTTLRILIGERHVQSISVQDTAIGLYYLTAFRRGLRGSDQFAEQRLHLGTSSQIKSETLNDQALAYLEEVASICLHGYNEPHEMERRANLCHGLTLLASMPAGSVLNTKHSTDTSPDNVEVMSGGGAKSGEPETRDHPKETLRYNIVPAFQLFVRDAPIRAAFLVIRGTASISDAMLDAAAIPVKLHNQEEEDNEGTVERKSEPDQTNEDKHDARDVVEGKGMEGDIAVEAPRSQAKPGSGSPYRVLKRAKTKRGKNKRSGRTSLWAHDGMNFAASWIEDEIRPVLSTLISDGYQLVVTGHSLGAGVAALLHGRLTHKIPSSYIHPSAAFMASSSSPEPPSPSSLEELDSFAASQCICFGTPPVASHSLARKLSTPHPSLPPHGSDSNAHVLFRGVVVSVVNHDDIVCRASAENARRLVEDIIKGQSQWQASIKQDVQSVALRASSLWAPRVRGGTKEGDANPNLKPVCPGSSIDTRSSEVKHHAALMGPLYVENDIRNLELNRSTNEKSTSNLSNESSKSSSSSRKDTQALTQNEFGDDYSEGGTEDENSCVSPIRFVEDEVEAEVEKSSGRSSLSQFGQSITSGIKGFWSSSSKVPPNVSAATSATVESHGTTNAVVLPSLQIETRPPNKVVQKVTTSYSSPHNRNSTVVNDASLSVELVVPGRVVHMYKRMGATIPALTPLTTSNETPACLKGIDPHCAMVDDHYLQNYLQSIRNCRATVSASLSFIGPPPGEPKLSSWKPFSSAIVCEACFHDFTWESTSSSPAQRLMDMHHCRCCGIVVCAACATLKRPLPDLGMPLPVRVCDRCFFTPR